MRLLYPASGEHEPSALYRLAAPPGRAPTTPWVVMNMIASIDGAVAVQGRSGGLGGPGDRAAFHALRAAADVVLVGAGTVRAERYGPPAAAGLGVAVVSAALDLDWSWPLFRSGRALVVTTLDAGDVPDGLPVLRAGRGRVDLAEALAQLGARGAGVVLCEGGPGLNGALLGAGLVDEICLTVAPVTVAGSGGRLAMGHEEHPTAMRLVHVATDDDGYLFLRYARAEGS